MKKTGEKIFIGTILAGAGVMAVSLLGNTSPMVKVNYIGERHTALFDCNGSMVHEFSTAEDYNRRFINIDKDKGEKADPPKKEGCKWIQSSRDSSFDTQDGFIHDGQYAEVIENGKNRVFFQLDGQFYNWPRERYEKVQNTKL